MKKVIINILYITFGFSGHLILLMRPQMTALFQPSLLSGR